MWKKGQKDGHCAKYEDKPTKAIGPKPLVIQPQHASDHKSWPWGKSDPPPSSTNIFF